MSKISRSVWIISIISLFTDMASELLYPIMPLYLKTIGFSLVMIGVLEGIAEAAAGLSKGYFGKRSDSIGKRLPFVQLGYTLSALSKPLMIAFKIPVWVFLMRSVDRLGKGIRTGARDAMLSAETNKENKARVFGFHRSMDTIGAVIGPSIALLYLYLHPGDYRTLFLLAIIPGLLAILCSTLLKEKTSEIKSISKTSFFSFIRYWYRSQKQYKQLTGALLIFTFFNSSDVFLLLYLKTIGIKEHWIIGVYIFYNLIYALTAYPMGILADRIGYKYVMVLGLFMFSLVYGGLSIESNVYIILFLFAAYGLFAASTEGLSKAWISNVCQKEETATAIGTYSAFQSIFSLLASIMAGIVWQIFGAQSMLLFSAVGSSVVLIYFIMNKNFKKQIIIAN